MKHFNIYITAFSLILSYVSNSQNVGINATGASAVASSMLDVTSANKGLLIPRIVLTGSNDVATIPSAATSLLIYNTATVVGANAITPGYYSWSGAVWVRESAYRGNDWGLFGNAGTVAATNFIGTTDGIDFVTRTNNTEKMRVTSAGNVGIGTSGPTEKLHVNGGNIFISDAAGSGGWIKGNDDHHSIYFREGGVDNTNYYEFSGTLAAGRGHRFFTGGIKTSQTVKMQIADDGIYMRNNLGIGNAAPLVKLDVVGAANIWSAGRFAIPNNYMAPGSLTLGNTTANFGGGGAQWTANTAGLLFECLDNTEIAVHDNAARVASIAYYEGGANRLHIGRDMGWGAISTIALNGNVGIGTISPSVKLEVAGQIKITGGAPGAGKTLISDATGLATWATPGTSTGHWGILGNVGTAAGTNFIGTIDFVDFVTRTNNTERMRVTGAGNVGIGTAAPVRLLNLNTAATSIESSVLMSKAGAGTGLVLGMSANPDAYTGGGTALNGKAFIHSNSGQDLQIAVTSVNNIEFGTSGVNRMYINSSGNVGIGTSSPIAKLDVQNGNASISNTNTWQTAVDIVNPTSAKTFQFVVGGIANNTGAAGVGGFGIYDNTAGFRFNINSNGNVGIGTTNPTAKLHLLTTGGDDYLRIDAPIWAQSSIAFSDFTNGNDIITYRPGGTRDYRIWTASVGDVVNVSQGGNVGIGTNFPNTKQHVVSNSSNVATFQTTGFGQWANIQLLEAGNSGLLIWGIGGGGGGAQICNSSSWFAPIQASSFIVSSDRRMKHDIHEIAVSEFDSYLNQIRNVSSATFKYNLETTRTENHIGVIAQTLPIEVQAAVSDIPGPDGKPRIGMSLADMAGLSLVGIKAIDYKQTEIEKLIATQQAMIDELKKEIELLKASK